MGWTTAAQPYVCMATRLYSTFAWLHGCTVRLHGYTAVHLRGCGNPRALQRLLDALEATCWNCNTPSVPGCKAQMLPPSMHTTSPLFVIPRCTTNESWLT
eukprot:350203-Chlamydomonas_euryale.AAC.5